MKMLIVTAVILQILIAASYAYAHSCNGKGPSAGASGLLALALCAAFTLALVFTIGVIVGSFMP